VELLRVFGAKVGKGVVIKPKVNIKYPWFLEIASWSEEEYLSFRRGARKFSEKFLTQNDFKSQYFKLFEIK
jgi:hypothetical protein